MSDLIAEGIKAYISYIKGYSDYCNNMLKIMRKSVEINIEELHPLSQVKTVDFFNGFMTGYEACKNDMKQLVPVHKEPADLYY